MKTPATRKPAPAIIRTLAELADHVGAYLPTPLSVDHRIYKDTACGAHLSAIFPGTPADTTRHTAEIRQTKGGRVRLDKLTPEHPEIRDFLGFNADGTAFDPAGQSDPWATLNTFAKACRELAGDKAASEKILAVRPCVGCLRVDITRDTPARHVYVHSGRDVPEGVDPASCIGVQVGSIVEGSDAEIDADPMYFPFPADEFDRMVEWVNDEACAAWDEAHPDGNP